MKRDDSADDVDGEEIGEGTTANLASTILAYLKQIVVAAVAAHVAAASRTKRVVVPPRRVDGGEGVVHSWTKRRRAGGGGRTRRVTATMMRRCRRRPARSASFIGAGKGTTSTPTSSSGATPRRCGVGGRGTCPARITATPRYGWT